MPAKKLVATAALLLAVTACSGPGSDSGSRGGAKGEQADAIDNAPTGELIADSGFRPDKDGFSFENYGNEGDEEVTNLTSEEVHELFGDEVCVDAEAEECDLIPPAQAWMEHTNAGMDGGHCYGMSMTALQLWQQTLKPADYGADVTPDLAKDANEPLQATIAKNFATQSGETLREQVFKGTPSQTVDRLVKAWKAPTKEGLSLGFYKRDGSGGHEVTPYALEKVADGKVNILLYDNNYPDMTQKLQVDLDNDTWMYKTTTKPGAPESVYEGDAETKPLELTPVKASTEVQPCPFCDRQSTEDTGGKGSLTAGEDRKIVYLDGDSGNHPHLLLTDDAGHRTGFVDGKLVNEIPGAEVGTAKGGKPGDDPEPEYYIPVNTHFTTTVDGSGLAKNVKNVQVGIISESFDVAAEQISVAKGAKDVFDVGADMSTFRYTASDAVSPVVHFGASISDDEYLTFNVGSSTDAPGSTLSATLPLDGDRFGRFYLDTSKVKGESAGYAIEVIYQDKKDEIRFTHKDYEIGTGGKVAVRWDKVDERHPYMPVLIKDGGQQTRSDLTPKIN